MPATLAWRRQPLENSRRCILILFPIRTVIGSRNSIRPLERVVKAFGVLFREMQALPPLCGVRLQVFSFRFEAKYRKMLSARFGFGRTNLPEQMSFDPPQTGMNGGNIPMKVPMKVPNCVQNETQNNRHRQGRHGYDRNLNGFEEVHCRSIEKRNTISDAPGKTYARVYTGQDAILIPEAPYIFPPFPRSMAGASPEGFPGNPYYGAAFSLS